jgi:aminopeptidase-like protein
VGLPDAGGTEAGRIAMRENKSMDNRFGEMPIEGEQIGEQMQAFVAQMYPLCRSITGAGFRETLAMVQCHIPLEIHEVPTGTPVFDWTVPKEWNIRDAYVKDSAGRRVIDFKKSNLHVVSYSVPVSATLSLTELKPHLFSIPEHPDWIPYRTTYYQETWGFCLSHHDLMEMKEDRYEVRIDSTLEPGHLTYGEYVLPGEEESEILLSCHACHPSLCNDNLSSVALLIFLAKHLSAYPRRYSYRFLFIPGTIGSITWLSLNEAKVQRIKHGLVAACTGDPGKTTYKKSRQGDAEIDRAVTHVLKHSDSDYEIIDFSPYGYDERQYNSPGFNLPVGCLMRTPHERYPEYHTSADDLAFVRPDCMADSFRKYLSVLKVLENNRAYLNLNPKCEPQLGKRGLYRPVGDDRERGFDRMSLLWVLNLSDGRHTLLDIAERAGYPFHIIQNAAMALLRNNLLEPVEQSAQGA